MKELDLTQYRLKNTGKVFRNLSSAKLVEEAMERKEGILASNGALIVTTGERTGRSPNDKFFVNREPSASNIWWSEGNVPIEEKVFDVLWEKAASYLQNRDLFVFDGFSGADREFHLPIRVIAQKAWHGLFSETLFVRPTKEDLENFEPEFTIIDAMDHLCNGKSDGVNSGTYVIVDMERKLLVVCGSGYGGEIKKSIFSIMNYVLPLKGVLSMHCSANVGVKGDAALFFGLSGTGKTTLSADVTRRLVGDDEHGWHDGGIFNLEGGCYAKVIRLSKEKEPQIYNAIKFGSILENVDYDPITREVDFDGHSITENTRATYPVEHIPGCITEGTAGHPKNVFFLTCDAFGVLPPISKLTPEQAMYHFISGYTAKVAGTEAGITEPEATFSACFGAPFLPLHPTRYATLLRDHISKFGANVWLVNTGWSGGAYGVGSRMDIDVTRALLKAALDGELEKVSFVADPTFKILIPKECPGVDSNLLIPKNTWTDKNAYDEKAKLLARLFVENFEKFTDYADEEIMSAAPIV